LLKLPEIIHPAQADSIAPTDILSGAGGGWKILMVAGEVSGDVQGSFLAEALLARDPTLRLYGTGGSRMKAAGVDLRIETTQFSTIGLIAALRFLAPLRGVFKKLQAIIRADRPAVAILIDNHGFNLAVAKFLKKEKIPVIYYFPPQLWVASSLIAGGVVRNTHLIISAFEREAKIYRRHGGRAVSLGHPSLDLVKPGPDPSSVLRKVGIDESRPVMALLPGSRRQEVERLAGLMFQAAAIIKRRIPEMQFLLPVASHHLKPRLQEICQEVGCSEQIHYVEEGIYSCLSRCAFVLAATGTATLEAALLGVPMVAAYRVDALSYWLARRLAITPFVAMPNILLEDFVVPELFQGDVTAENLANAALGILENPARSESIKERFRRLPEILGGRGAVERVVDLIFSEVSASVRSSPR
jgi:lipid-A-disaccharide synthase